MTQSLFWCKNKFRKSDQGRKGSDIDFFRYRIIGKNALENSLKLPDGYGKVYFINLKS